MKKKAANRRPSQQRLDERDLDYDDEAAADKNVPDHVKDNDDYGDGEAKDLFYESDDDLLSKKEKRKREDMDAQLELDANARRETAEEKRRRLARLYLDKLRREAALEGDDDTDLDENDDVDPSVRKRQRDLDSHDRLANKLANEAAEAAGRHFREIADDVKPTKSPVLGTYFSRKAHKQSVTGVCLSSDDRTAFSVSKDGAIVEWDVETGKRTKYPRCPVITEEEMRTKGGGGPMAPPRSGAGILLAVACASEKNIVAVAGNDKRIHVFDMRTKKFVTTFAGHRGAVTGLTFRHGTGQLFSCSEDRTVKIWSVDDMAYVDTLFGHQSELYGIDAHKRERCATVSSDRTLRAWKVAEDSQLVFRPAMNDDKRKDYAMECVASVSHDHWITGARDGAVSLWSASKKKPLSTFSNVHGYDEPIGLPKNWEEEDGEIVLADRMATQEFLNLSLEDRNRGGCGYLASSVVSAAVGRGTNLCATGAGDGTIRLWKATPGEKDTALEPKHSLPQRGFVNGLAIASSGKFLLAGVGQEPRLGRWGRDAGAKNGVVMHRLDHIVEDDSDEDDSDDDEEDNSDGSMDEEEMDE
jgi:ribosomal RNA-processing protein 9